MTSETQLSPGQLMETAGIDYLFSPLGTERPVTVACTRRARVVSARNKYSPYDVYCISRQSNPDTRPVCTRQSSDYVSALNCTLLRIRETPAGASPPAPSRGQSKHRCATRFGHASPDRGPRRLPTCTLPSEPTQAGQTAGAARRHSPPGASSRAASACARAHRSS